MKRKLSIIIPILLIAGTSTWIIINRIKKKKLHDQLIDDLQTGANSGDAQQSIGTLTKKGGALDPNYVDSVPSPKKLIASAGIAAGVKKIHGYIHGILGSNEDALINFFSKCLAKTVVSQFAKAYQQTYKISLAEDLKTIDNVIGGSYNPFPGSADLPKIIAVISALPDK
jgi:hypothetical protein